jgi:hypothetical protein
MTSDWVEISYGLLYVERPMPLQITSFAAKRIFAIPIWLKRFRTLLACLALPCLLGGCMSMIAGGMVLEYPVSYPMRSPEYVLRDLGGNRYLLGQWKVPMNGNSSLRTRYYDRNTGLLSVLPSDVAIVREGYTANVLGILRYESDSPLQLAFFADRWTGYNPYCEQPEKPATANAPKRPCGYMEIVLSLDGGHSFAWRRINIPTPLGRNGGSPRQYEFAIVRSGTLYLGLYVSPGTFPDICCYAADGTLGDRQGVPYARRFSGQALADKNAVFLAVLAMPLPENDGKALPAEHIPKELSAYLLNGPALLAFDPGQPMALLETPPAKGPKPPTGHYKRADRRDYIESLRADYPEWAAHQTLDGIPWREQWMTTEKINGLRARQPLLPDDPVEWVRFDRPMAR